MNHQEIKPNKRGYYKCPYGCGDPRYPKPKWKTEKGILGHMAKCGHSPEGVKRKEEAEQARVNRNEERKQELLKTFPHKIGDKVNVIGYRVTKPTHVQRGNRMARVRYEEGRSYFTDTVEVKSIEYMPDSLVVNNRYTKGDIFETLEEANKKLEERRAGYEEHCEFASNCR